jgi:hypothetical protein
MSDLHPCGISYERLERLIRRVERILPKSRMFYIGRTNDLKRRRDDHYEWGSRDFDCMVKIDEFRGRNACGGVEQELIRHFRKYYRCGNIADDCRGGWGAGPQYIYVMWEER